MGNLTLNGSTSGQVTLTPPAVAGTNTITLPAATGTVLTTAGGQTISGTVTLSTLTSPAATNLTIQSAGTTAMTIDTSQNVGIGTTSPGQKLEVRGGLNVGYSSGQGVYFQNSDGTNNYEIYNVGATGAGNPVLSFYQTGTGERMRIDSSGNVGVGTSSPSTYSAKFVSYGAFGTSTPAISLVNSSAENTNNVAETQYWLTNSFSGLVNVAKIGAISGSTGNQYGALYFSTSNAGAPTERMRIDSSGILMLGTTSTNPVTSRVNGFIVTPGFGINLRGASQTCAFGLSSSSGTNIGFYTDNGSSAVSAGSITSNGSSTAYNTSSDYRLKENIALLSSGIENIQKLRPVSYTWKEGYGNGAGEGFIAHELAEHIPLAVTGEKDAVDEEGNIKPQGVDYSKIVVHLVAAMQEQQSIISDLKSRIAALEAK